MTKPVKESVAIVVKDKDGRFLVVKRAEGDTFAGKWGLPAASLRDGESHEDAALRAAKDKLGIEVKVLDKVGDDKKDKGDHISHLTEYNVDVLDGEPTLETRDPTVSRYDEIKFTDDPHILVDAAKDGSLCSRIYLRSQNVDW